MNRYTKTYTTFTVKEASDGEQRIVKGIASTQTPDRDGDIVEPSGANFVLPIPLLWQHDREKPIGEVVAAQVTEKGNEVEIHLAQTQEPGKLKDRLDEAWQSIKMGLVKGLSVGFRAKEYSFLDDGGIHFTAWDWYELSAVTIPANAEAGITDIKAACTPQEQQKQPAQEAEKELPPETATEPSEHLADTAPDVQKQAHIIVKLPTIGRGVKL